MEPIEVSSLSELWDVFLSNVEIDAVGSFTSGCWEWVGRKSDGYGCFVINSRYYASHRIIAGAVSLPSYMHVHHVCENKSCISPSHLQVLTSEEHLELHQKGGRYYTPIRHLWEGDYVP